MKKLLDKYTNEQIILKLIEIYPDQESSMKGYLKVLKQLRKMKPKKDDMVIVAKSKFNIYGLAQNGETFAIEFTRWENWLGMKVKTKVDGLTAFCYCLWEMTFMGFSQSPIQRKINKLNKIVKEIDVSV